MTFGNESVAQASQIHLVWLRKFLKSLISLAAISDISYSMWLPSMSVLLLLQPRFCVHGHDLDVSLDVATRSRVQKWSQYLYQTHNFI